MHSYKETIFLDLRENVFFALDITQSTRPILSQQVKFEPWWMLNFNMQAKNNGIPGRQDSRNQVSKWETPEEW